MAGLARQRTAEPHPRAVRSCLLGRSPPPAGAGDGAGPATARRHLGDDRPGPPAHSNPLASRKTRSRSSKLSRWPEGALLWPPEGGSRTGFRLWALLGVHEEGPTQHRPPGTPERLRGCREMRARALRRASTVPELPVVVSGVLVLRVSDRHLEDVFSACLRGIRGESPDSSSARRECRSNRR